MPKGDIPEEGSYNTRNVIPVDKPYKRHTSPLKKVSILTICNRFLYSPNLAYRSVNRSGMTPPGSLYVVKISGNYDKWLMMYFMRGMLFKRHHIHWR